MRWREAWKSEGRSQERKLLRLCARTRLDQLEGDATVVRVTQQERVSQARGARRIEEVLPAHAAPELNLLHTSQTKDKRRLRASAQEETTRHSV